MSVICSLTWHLGLTTGNSTRLREEVDVLMHLCRAAGTSVHPNVLGYVDSWEQDETLYILTELCDYGNFAHFLGEYGHHFARLDEARVWKVFADLSNVSPGLSGDPCGCPLPNMAQLVPEPWLRYVIGQ